MTEEHYKDIVYRVENINKTIRNHIYGQKDYNASIISRRLRRAIRQIQRLALGEINK